LKVICNTIAPFGETKTWQLAAELLLQYHPIVLASPGWEVGPEADAKQTKAARCTFLSRCSLAEAGIKNLLKLFQDHLSDGI